MANRVSAEIVSIGSAQISRGEIKFKTREVRPEKGEPILWKDISADRRIADLIHPGVRGVFYVSKFWGQIYGFRPEGGEGAFHTFLANVLALLMCIGMVFGGLFTAVFVFGIFVGIAGIAGFFMCLDARNARAKFNTDRRALRRAQTTRA